MDYLDYNATTPLAPQALEAMMPFLNEEYGNASSIHAAGRQARAAVDDARDQLAEILGVKAHELIFTSGGTESCNLAVLGLARAHACKGKHLITSSTEHHAVLNTFEHLHHHEGFDLTILPVDENGCSDIQQVADAIRPDTTLVSVMTANNETGTLQPVDEIAALCRDHRVLFHTDAVQSFGKASVKPRAMGASALSIAAHKFYGPKGAGLLFLGAGVAISRIGHGGSHENTRRPGTENVAAIVGMAAAAKYANERHMNDQPRLARLRDSLWEGIHRIAPEAVRNGHPSLCLANTLNISFPDTDGEALLIGLDLEGICASSGSACMVGSVQPSHVLLAMGVDPALASATVRFSLGADTAEPQIEHCVRALSHVLERQHQPAHA